MLGAKLAKFWLRSKILGREQIFGFGSEISCWEQKFMLGTKFCAGSKISCREQNFRVGSEILGWERNFMLVMKFRVRGDNSLEMGQFNAKKI